MAQKGIITVKPIFSLKDKNLEKFLSSKVVAYEQKIEAALDRYEQLEELKEISIDKLNIRLRSLPGTHSAPLQKAVFIYCEKETVTTPFLLGLILHQEFLSKIRDIQSIEIFEEEQLFFDEYKRPTQLCLRRQESGWFIDISTYVYNNKINAGERESGTSINTLSFVEDRSEEIFEDPELKEDLKNKMIG